MSKNRTAGPLLYPDKPLETAREFVQCRYTLNSAPTIRPHNGTFYRWTGNVELREEHINAELYAFLDSAQQPASKGKAAPFNPTSAKVREVRKALAAEVQLPNISAPAWIDTELDLPAKEILVCRNGMLPLPTLQLCPHSPALFSLNALDYDYDPNAPEPIEWLRFLDSIWGDDQQSIAALQEMFGLFLTHDASYQKIFMSGRQGEDRRPPAYRPG